MSAPRDTRESADVTPAEALYAAEWEMRKAVGVCADSGDEPVHQEAVRLLQRWSGLRRRVRAGRSSNR